MGSGLDGVWWYFDLAVLRAFFPCPKRPWSAMRNGMLCEDLSIIAEVGYLPHHVSCLNLPSFSI